MRHTLLLHDQTDRQRIDAVRRDFVANASHELKTPVAGIQALSDALTVTIDRWEGGTGLGLSIVRHAVERHGGSVRVASLLGEGTAFTVQLPVQPPAAPPTPIR